mmetsp:Transcript_3064/g.5911  ORF Transcript_3064/g.5911 Transcript_3064/m.5911 type:complete len:218 (+) Transcript_3064:1980-2633(+)
MDCQHPLVLRVERDLEHFLVFRLLPGSLCCSGTAAHFRGRPQDGHLSGRSDPSLHAVVNLEVGSVVQDSAQRNAGQLLLLREDFGLFVPVVHLQTFDHRHRAFWHNEILHCHLSGRQRARLVRAEHRHAAKRLDGVNLADDHISCGHLVRGDHERDRDSWQQALWHLGEERRCSVLQDLRCRSLHGRHHVGHQAQKADADCHNGDDVDEVLDLDLQR